MSQTQGFDFLLAFVVSCSVQVLIYSLAKATTLKFSKTVSTNRLNMCPLYCLIVFEVTMIGIHSYYITHTPSNSTVEKAGSYYDGIERLFWTISSTFGTLAISLQSLEWFLLARMVIY